jgi:ABC-type Zn uptake system ZnuABC Zn-binding protein ZnuA
MSNKSEKLYTLQDMLIDEFVKRIQTGEATAADLSAARQLLKDNGIQAIATEDSPMLELVKSLPFEDDSEPLKISGQKL